MYKMLLYQTFKKRRKAYSARYRRKYRFAYAMVHQLYRLAFPSHNRELDSARNCKGHSKYPIRAALWAKRRAQKYKATCGDPKAIAKIIARAQELRQWFDVVVDHKIPLCKGGTHSPDNLQIIYARENAEKGSRLDYTPTVIFS